VFGVWQVKKRPKAVGVAKRSYFQRVFASCPECWNCGAARFVAAGSNVRFVPGVAIVECAAWGAKVVTDLLRREIGMTRFALIVLVAGLAWSGGTDRGAAQGITQGTIQGAAQDGNREGAAPAQGPETVAPAEAGRYSFHRRGEDFIRLDSQTGQLSQCGWSAVGWSCTMAPDERTAFESEIGRLQRENAALKGALLSRGLDLPAGILADTAKPQSRPQPGAEAPRPPADVPDPSRDNNVTGPKPPGEADLDRAVAYIKSVWRRLVEMMVDQQRDIQLNG
jgi:hypothetical protein